MSRAVVFCLSSTLFFGSVAQAHDPNARPPGEASDCAQLALAYRSLAYDVGLLRAEAQRSLSSRPGLAIEDVLWVGQGEYELTCGGRFPGAQKVGDGVKPEIDTGYIEGWSRGNGTPETPGTYTFKGTARTHPVTEYEPTEENLALFGARLAKSGDRATFYSESVHAVYLYKENYFSDWVERPGPLGGSRIERHPVDHLFTLAKPLEGDPPSHFILGRVLDGGKLELGAIRLRPGITIVVPANTVHTNDYVRGTLEEIYPRVWGIDEVFLVNEDGQRVALVPGG